MVTQQAHTSIHEAVVADFRTTLRGDLLTPGDDGYDAARVVWNGMIDKRPAMIARCRGVADVMGAVNVAREQRMDIAVRGGGHNVSGNAVCDDGLMIDLSLMKGIHVDPVARTVRAEPGVLWNELDHETQRFGLATTGGTISATGIAGLTLGGGVGWLSGKFGMAIDNLLSVDIVTADGQLRHASATENSDLFWGVRGAGANLGIVTSFEYRLHPVGPTILGGLVINPIDRTGDVLRFYREFASTQPDELTTYAAILSLPDATPVVAMVCCFTGNLDDGERAVAPLKYHGQPMVDTIGPMPYTALQTMLDGAFPYGHQNYWKSGYVTSISDAMIQTIVEQTRSIPSPQTVVLIQDFHGAASRVPNNATAFAHRHAPHSVAILSNWTNPAENERQIAWTRSFFAALEPQMNRGVYVNELGAGEADRVRDAYGENYERLVALKTKYDPTNLFRLNQNIVPTQ